MTKLLILLIILIGSLVYGLSKNESEAMEFSQPVRANYVGGQAVSVSTGSYVHVDETQKSNENQLQKRDVAEVQSNAVGNRQNVTSIPKRGTGFIKQDVVEVDEAKSQKVKAFLESKGSPLSLYASVFVWCGARYGIDPYLLVGISRIESSFGVHYPKATHNPFGLSGGGHLIRFPSLVHSIDYLGKTIAEERYYRKWQETGEISDLAVVFCPPNSKHWTDVVTQTIKEIEEL